MTEPARGETRWPVGGGEMAALVRGLDWSSTPLGPIDRWPQGLRTVVDLVLASGFPMVALWGPELVQIYNDGYRRIMGPKHPRGLGQRTAECWPEVWAVNAPIYRRVEAGETVSFEDALYPIRRGDEVEDAWFTLSYSPLRDEGDVAGVLVTVIETTDRVRAGAQLRDSEERYRAFVTASSDVVYRMGPDWTEMRQLDGRGFLSDTAEPSGGWMERYILPEDQPTVRAAIDRAIRTKSIFELEHRVRRADGTTGWTSSRAVPVLDPAGDVKDWIGAASDVTPRKEAETAMRASEARFRTLAEVAPEIVWSGTGSEVDFFNRRWHDYTGLDEEASRQPDAWRRVVHPDDLPTAVERSERAAATGERYEIEYRLRGRDGTYRWHIARAFQVAGTNRWVGAATDIDDLKRAETSLRESDARFRSMAEAIEDVFYVTDLQRNALVYLSPAYERIWGWSRESLLAHLPSFLDTLHPDDRAGFLDGKLRQERGEPTQLEYRVVRPDGSVRRVLDRSFPVPDAVGKVSAGVATDVTERRAAAEALRESEDRYRLTLEGARDYAIFTTDTEGRIATWPPGAEAVFGWSAAEAVGQPVAMTFTPEDRERGEPERELAGARESGHAPDVRWHLRKDGSRVFIEGSMRPIRGGGGFLKIGQDVTERRRADAALQASEELFRSFAENSADTLWILDAESMRLEYLSPAFEAMWGESRDRVLADLGRWAELVHPDDREKAQGGMPRLLRGEPYQQTYRIRRANDGEVRFIQDTGFPIRDPGGGMRRVGGVAQDVTEEVAAQRRLTRSERRLRSLVEGIPQLVWRGVDLGHWTWSSPQWSAYTGLSAEASLGRGWLDALHPDDRAAAIAAWRQAEAGEATLAVEYRLRRAADGLYRWFSTRAAPLRDEASGEVLEWLGASTDIDDLRQLQERQRLLVAELQHRVRNTLGVVRSIARRTAATSDTVDDYAMHLAGRLDAFARVQGAVTRDPAGGVDLAMLVADELMAYGAQEGEQVGRLGGPKVRLQPKAAETLALALHELATNAVKHGALSAERGRVAVTWRMEDGPAPRLVLEWAESGIRLSGAPPTRRGFGTELIERTLAYDLGAETALSFPPTGLRCTISLPAGERLLKA